VFLPSVNSVVAIISLKTEIMNKEQKDASEGSEERNAEPIEENEKLEEKIDEELEETFPASDPPSFSQPGNDDIKRNT